MEKQKFNRANPRFKAGMVFCHRKYPGYIIKLLKKGQHSRWLCEVVSGGPPKGSGVNRFDTRPYDDISHLAGAKFWKDHQGKQLVEYSTCAFNNCFIESELAEVLYGP